MRTDNRWSEDAISNSASMRICFLLLIPSGWFLAGFAFALRVSPRWCKHRSVAAAGSSGSAAPCGKECQYLTGLERLRSIPQQCQEYGGGTRTEENRIPDVVEWAVGGLHQKLWRETVQWNVKKKKKVSILKKVYLVSAGIYQKSIFQRVCIVSEGWWKRKKKFQLCWDERTPLIHKHSRTAANETLVDSLPCRRTEAGVRSGHNRKRSRDYMKGRTDSQLRMNLEEVKVFIPGGGIGGGACCAVKPSSWLKLKSLSEEEKIDKRSRICGGCQDRRWL